MNNFNTEQRAAIARLEQAFRECAQAGVRFRGADQLMAFLQEDETAEGEIPRLAVRYPLRTSGAYRGELA
ncbi:MAG: hypothetical protein ACYTDW_03185 [Planctomycetota bacterium]|jgi:hypothetical protein